MSNSRLQQQKSRKDLGEEGSELIGIDEEDEEDDEGNENGNANDPRLGSPLSGALEGVAEEGEDDEEEGGRETGAAAVVNFALGTKRPTAQTRRVARGKTFRTTRKSRRMADEFDLVYVLLSERSTPLHCEESGEGSVEAGWKPAIGLTKILGVALPIPASLRIHDHFNPISFGRDLEAK